MSTLSKYIFDPLKNAFSHAATSGSPATQAAAASATANLTQAASLVEQSMGSLVLIAANFVLGLIPGGPAFEGLADAFLEAVIVALQAKKTTASLAIPAPPAAP